MYPHHIETPNAAPTASHTLTMPTHATSLRPPTTSHRPSVQIANANMMNVPIAMFMPEPTELS